jgi:hypothetical protein
MEAKTALLIALAVAVGLPYVTVALLRTGSAGVFAVGALFIGAFLLVVASDLRGAETAEGDADAGAE